MTATRLTASVMIVALTAAALARAEEPPRAKVTVEDVKTETQKNRVKAVRPAAPFVGLSLRPLTTAGRRGVTLPAGIGMRIAQVVKDSPAATGGVLANDVLHMLNGQLIINQHQFTTLVHSMAVGDEVLLAVIRDGKPKVVQVKLGERAKSPAPIRFRLGDGKAGVGPAGRELDAADWEQLRGQLGGQLGGQIRRAVEEALIEEGVVDRLAEEGVGPRLLDEALGQIEDGAGRSESRVIRDAEGNPIGNVTIIRRSAVIEDDGENPKKRSDPGRREKP